MTAPAGNHSTVTPFQPGNGDNNSPYDSPTSTVTPPPTPTIRPARVPPGTEFIEITPFPSPLPSDFKNSLVAKPRSNTNPLTGLTASDPGLLERRPLAIKITQYPRYVRPQSGLSLADVVYEYYIEDGLSRFIAVFYGNNSARVGPVRSGRFFDEHVVRMYQAFFVFKYADPRVYDYYKESDLKDYLVVPGSGACPPFVVGQAERDTYNNIFLNTEKFNRCISRRTGVENARPSVQSVFFSSFPPRSNRTATRIYTEYSSEDYNYWEYLPVIGRYQRYQELDHKRNGRTPTYAPLLDAVTNLPVQADNVVVLFVPHRFASQFNQEDEVYNIDLYGSGDAYVFRNGIALQATWHRTQLDQPILLMSSEGFPVYLKPGATFYQVIGKTSETWQEDADWHFIWQDP